MTSYIIASTSILDIGANQARVGFALSALRVAMGLQKRLDRAE
jgi:hypothetical protein